MLAARLNSLYDVHFKNIEYPWYWWVSWRSGVSSYLSFQSKGNAAAADQGSQKHCYSVKKCDTAQSWYPYQNILKDERGHLI